MNDILEGYSRKQKKEYDKLVFQAKTARKAAFVTILPHTKNLTEKKFNSQIWPIDEVRDEEQFSEEKKIKMREAVKSYNLQLKEKRLKKQKK